MSIFVINKSKSEVALVTPKEFAVEFWDWRPVTDVVREQAARIAELEAALEPFANAAKHLPAFFDSNDGLWTLSAGNGKHIKITVGDCRHARALLAKKG